MLDIKFIRENADIVKFAAKKKKVNIDIDRLLAVDDLRRDTTTMLETKKGRTKPCVSRYCSRWGGRQSSSSVNS